MRRTLGALWRVVKGLPLALLSPILLVIAALLLLLCDLVCGLRPRRRLPGNAQPDTSAASIVIPNWNGRDLLNKYLPSVVAALENHPDTETTVVDNGSTDDIPAFVRDHFPHVPLLSL